MNGVESDIELFLQDLRLVVSSSVNVSAPLAGIVADAIESKSALPPNLYPAWKKLIAFRDAANALRADTELFDTIRKYGRRDSATSEAA